MELLLRGLLRDLATRCDAIKARLSVGEPDPEVNDRALSAYKLVEQVRRDVNSLLASPALSAAQLLPNHLRLYKRWRELVTLIEHYPLTFVERYGPNDRRLTAFCRDVASEIGWPLPVPLVGAFSHQYYWTNPLFGLINLPAAEGTGLLGLPDLFHEMGHILLVHHEGALIGDFRGEVARYVDEEIGRVDSNQRPPEYRERYETLLAAWSEAWVFEFACDMIATYVVGGAYGWQHLRLCAGMGHAPYHPTLGEIAEHPADHARLHGIATVVEYATTATDIRESWESFVQLLGESKSPDYDLAYPDSLIESLAGRIRAGCEALGLRHFEDAGPIVRLIQEAWQRFRTDPDGYGEWEAEAIDSVGDREGTAGDGN